MNMKKWTADVIAAERKKPMPVLSFPCVTLMGINVRELISSAENQARGMKLVADKVDTLASVSMMDLSVEAEAFGSEIKFEDFEVPAVRGAIVTSEEQARELTVPSVGTARTGIYVKAISDVCKTVTDRPVFAGTIGPFSLAGRLVGVSEALVNCYDEPDMMKIVADKAADFLIEYIKAYKAVGANGIVMAEPLTGLLSPALAEEFSEPYVRRIIEAVQDDDFIVIYHNCGNYTIQMIDSILRTGAAGFHFGNSIDMAQMLPHIPADKPVFGNVDPASQFRNGTPESIKAETKRIMTACCGYKNFVISSGCDIPPRSSWDNITAFMSAVKEFYDEKV